MTSSYLLTTNVFRIASQLHVFPDYHAAASWDASARVLLVGLQDQLGLGCHGPNGTSHAWLWTVLSVYVCVLWPITIATREAFCTRRHFTEQMKSTSDWRAVCYSADWGNDVMHATVLDEETTYFKWTKYTAIVSESVNSSPKSAFLLQYADAEGVCMVNIVDWCCKALGVKVGHH